MGSSPRYRQPAPCLSGADQAQPILFGMADIPPPSDFPRVPPGPPGLDKKHFPSKPYLVIQTLLAIAGSFGVWGFVGFFVGITASFENIGLGLYFWSWPAGSLISLVLTGWGIAKERMRPIWIAAALPFVLVAAAIVVLFATI